MKITNLVVDDLREFIPPRPDTIYLRSKAEYIRFTEDNSTLHVENLYLDFDLGEGDNNTTRAFSLIILGSTLPDMPEDLRWTFENIFIITANPVAKKDLFQTFTFHHYCAKNVIVGNAEDFELINLVDW